MQVLSDVHVHFTGHAHAAGVNLSETRFFFRQPWLFKKDGGSSSSMSRQYSECSEAGKEGENQDSNLDQEQESCKCDEDGDLLVQRKHKDSEDLVITIVHAMATELSHVGQQVWLGALLLCDFLLHYSPMFKDKIVLDLGAGVGLTSMVAAFSAATVFCTDKGDDVLNLARLNMERNHCLHHNGDIRVCELDWTADSPFTVNPECPSESKSFCLSHEDVKCLQSCSVILAAEVVYDLELTDAFFRMLYSLLLVPPVKSVYMTVEKRQVFTIADKEMVSPAYEHFRENLQDLCSIDEGPVRFLCSQIDLSFPQYFHYQRTRELELWKIESVFMHTAMPDAK